MAHSQISKEHIKQAVRLHGESASQKHSSCLNWDSVRTGLDPHKILIVDDERDIRDSLKQLLEFEGYEVTTAANGQEAYQYLLGNLRPSLIVLDLMMPIMNGWEFSDTISRNSVLSDIPVILLTAFSDQTFDIQANDVLRKPVDLERLIPAIKRNLGN